LAIWVMAIRGIILGFSPYRRRQITVRRDKAQLLLDGQLGCGRLQVTTMAEMWGARIGELAGTV